MKTKDFNKLIKKDDPKHIIYLYTMSKVFLTSSQLQKVIDLKSGGARC